MQYFTTNHPLTSSIRLQILSSKSAEAVHMVSFTNGSLVLNFMKMQLCYRLNMGVDWAWKQGFQTTKEKR